MSTYAFGSLNTQLGALSVEIVVDDGLSDVNIMDEKIISDLILSYELEGRLGIFNIGDLSVQLNDDDGDIWNVLDAAAINNYDVNIRLLDSGSKEVFNGFILLKSVMMDESKFIISFVAVDSIVYNLQRKKVDEIQPISGDDVFPVRLTEFFNYFGKTLNYSGFPTWTKFQTVWWEANFSDCYVGGPGIIFEYGSLYITELIRQMCQFFGAILFFYAGAYYFNYRTSYLSTLQPTLLQGKERKFLLNQYHLPGIYYTGMKNTVFAGNQNAKNTYEMKALDAPSGIIADATPQGGGSPTPVYFTDAIVQQTFDDIYEPFYINKNKRFLQIRVEEFVHPGRRIQIGADYYYFVKARNHLTGFMTDLEIVKI